MRTVSLLQTRAEVLARVVDQIRELQQKNSELQSKMKELESPQPTSENDFTHLQLYIFVTILVHGICLFVYVDGEELSRQAVQLVEENLRLRALLLGCVRRNESHSPSLHSGEESREAENTGESREDVQVLTDGEVEGEMGELERQGPLITTISSSHRQRKEGNDAGERVEKGNEDKNDKVDNASRADGAKGNTAEQPWPISSLLSDHSGTGPRDHPAFNLPILSPTYIAEHCSTAACETQFLSPPVSTPPSTSSLSNTGRNGSLCSHALLHAPTTETLTITATDGVPSTTCTVDSTGSSISPVHTFPTHGVAPAISHLSHHPRSHPAPCNHSLPLTRQSIVQPWVGGSSRTENAVVLGSATSRQTFPATCMSQVLEPDTERQPVHHARLHGCNHHNSASLLNYRPSRYAPRPPHSTRLRAGRNSMRTCSSRYANTGDNYTTGVSVPGVFPSHTRTNLAKDRAHCSERRSYPSTGPSFPMQTGSAVLFQSSSFPSPSSVDPYFHHSVQQPLHNPPSHHQPTRHNSRSHPSHNFSHHVHQHNYNLTPHPHHLTPHPHTHPHHPQHTPSHHNTVWRPYSDRQRTSTRFSLSDILSPSPTSGPTLGLPAPASHPVHQSPGGRIPSFFVDHLLDDL